MLIEKKPTIDSGTIIAAKLITGEEIIAKIISVTNDGYNLTKPLSLAIGHNGAAMVPFVICMEDDQIFIDKTKIIALGRANQNVSDQYTKMTTGIEVVRQPKITL